MGRTVTHRYRSSGSFTVRLRVFDNQGTSSFTTQSVNVQGQPNQTPIASFNVSTATPEAGDPVTFTSTAFDPDGSINRTTWRFGDGSSAQGQRVQHTYARAGTFTATLTVTDNRGATASVSRQIEVGSALPSGPGFFVEALDDSRLRVVIQGRSSWPSNRPFSLQLEADGQITSVERRSGGAAPQGAGTYALIVSPLLPETERTDPMLSEIGDALAPFAVLPSRRRRSTLPRTASRATRSRLRARP